MKTSILLHGGRLRNKDPRNDSYFKRLTQDLEDGDTVLFIGFARENEEDEIAQFQKEKQWILRQTDKDVEVQMATRDNLITQMDNAKSIEITGGDSPKLVEIISGYPDFVTSLGEKTVGGSSAGAYLFSKHYYNNASGTVMSGLGLLPIRISVHMDNPEFGNTAQKRTALQAIDDGTELILLDEAEWIERTLDIPENI